MDEAEITVALPDERTQQQKKIRLAVVSPFLDKRHGTERIVTEWLNHLPADFELHIFSQRVEQMERLFTWHRVFKLPGPHLFNFLWWTIANRLCRLWSAWAQGRPFDLVYTPGANCLDADAISIHIVFGDYMERVRPAMQWRGANVRSWPRILHRKLYYSVARWMERRAYRNSETTLVLCARKTGDQIRRLYGRKDQFPVIYIGVDHSTFNPACREKLRSEARGYLLPSSNRFVVLLIGNDWRNKGVPCLLDAVARLGDLPIHALIVTGEDSEGYRELARRHQIEGRVSIAPPRADVEFYYAAADAYAAPSLEDTFGLPPQEAMACGLPVIVSASNGTSEIITDGVDGLILQDPTDAATLAAMIRRLHDDAGFRMRLGENASQTASRYTWQRNGQQLAEVFYDVLRQKAAHTTA